LDWKQVNGVDNPLEQVISQCPTVFGEGLGTYTGKPARILIVDTARTRFWKARPVPYDLKDLVND
jgi:hypothetical protein